MRKGWSVRRKGEACLKTTLAIGKRIHTREPVRSGNFGKMKSLMIMNSYCIEMLFDLLSSHNNRVVLLSEYSLK